MSNSARTQWMLDQIKAIKDQHTVGTGEAFHILKIRDAYEALRTPVVTLTEVMNLCNWLKGVVRFFLVQQFFEMMTPEDQVIKIDELEERCADIPQHHENILGPKEYKVSSKWENEWNEVNQTDYPTQLPDRLPIINYEAFKPHWALFKALVGRKQGKRFEDFVQILTRVSGWLVLPGSGDENKDPETSLRNYFLSFAMDESEAVIEFDMLSSTRDDSSLNNYSGYYQFHQESQGDQLEDFSKWLQDRELTAPPEWEMEQLYTYDRLFQRFSNELISHRLEARRELAIAYVIGELRGGKCNDQLLDRLNKRLLESVKNAKIRKARQGLPEVLEEIECKMILRLQYMIPCLLENRAFLKKYFNS